MLILEIQGWQLYQIRQVVADALVLVAGLDSSKMDIFQPGNAREPH
jgi:hypothetical protein